VRRNRWAAVGLTLVLLVLTTLAVAESRVLSDRAERASRAAVIQDSYQDARYYAARQAAELDAYVLVPTQEGRRRQADASRQLDEALADVVSAVGDEPAARGERERERELAGLAGVQAQQARYEAVASRVIATVDTSAEGAALLDEESALPLDHGIQDALSLLEERRYADATDLLGQLRRAARVTLIGTPVVLAGCLLLFAVFASIISGYRRSLERQALRDVLTGLPNRLAFSLHAEQVLREAGRRRLTPAVLLLDLDKFKEVNDTLGHGYGDDLLVEVGRRVTAVLGGRDIVARLGGDEFVVLISHHDPARGEAVARKIQEALSLPFHCRDTTLAIEASIGVSTGETAGAGHLGDLGDLMRRADVAMYTAKSQQLEIVRYSDEHDESTRARLELLGALRRALDGDELVAHYQPKIESGTGRVIGVEALARWQHPTRGLLAPAEFIELAEVPPLIHQLTETMIRQSLARCATWRSAGRTVPVSVNISTRSLLEEDFPATVEGLLAEASVPAVLLCLEITESTLMVDPDRSLAVMERLRALGVRLSIDDFGTGYSSMAYLKVLPVQELKIDCCFVRDLIAEKGSQVIVRTAVDLGHQFGLTVVAEGVEDAATAHALELLGVDGMQGYHFGRPMPAEELSGWLAAHRTTSDEPADVHGG